MERQNPDFERLVRYLKDGVNRIRLSTSGKLEMHNGMHLLVSSRYKNMTVIKICSVT